MTDSATDHAPVTPSALFADADFRRLWISGALAGTMRWMDTLVAAVVVFRMSESALAVAMILFLRTLPMLLFGLFAGALLDRFNRQRIILVCLAALSLASATLCVLAATDALAIWHIGAAAFLGGVYWTTEHPGRRALIGEIAGPARIGAAMGFDSSTINLTRLAGPPLGGLVLQQFGFATALAIAALGYAIAASQMARVRYSRPPVAAATAATTLFAQIGEGFRHVANDRRIAAVLLGTAAMNLFAFPYAGMIVPIGQTQLGAGPVAIGLLQAAEATGALICSLGLAFFGRAEWYMRLFLGGSVLLLAAILGFGLSGSYPLSFAILFIGGFGFAGFGTMQSTIIMMQAPPAMRSRIMGTLTVCIGTGPIGVLLSGLLADRVGAATTVVTFGLAGILSMLALCAAMPDLLRHRRPSPSP